MDDKDVRISCEIVFRNPGLNSVADRRSPTQIGRKVGLDEKTVRIRVRKREESGFIKYYQAMPNLRLMGVNNPGWYRFGTLNLTTKRDLVEYLQLTRNVLETFDYTGNFASAAIAATSETEVQRVARG